MSVVGPRPLVQSTFDAYSTEVQEHIYTAIPGITGIGSVVFRDEEKYISESGQDPKAYYNDVVAPFKGELELWYLANRSMWTDLKIICLTAMVDNISFERSDFKSFPKFA